MIPNDINFLAKDSDECRVLSIQSHVVHGYVGNKCAVFPLQLHGFEVDAINSVQFSNHTYYSHFKGQVLNSDELSDIYEGLCLNKLNSYSHILTGYCADGTFLRKLSEIVSKQRLVNPKLLYFCDPVLGDEGQYYVPEKLMTIYRDHVVPLAHVVMPNQFELSQLSGIDVQTEAECLMAIEKLHDLGPKIVVVTSSHLSADKQNFSCYGSSMQSNGSCARWRFELPLLPYRFVGTGDLFASLLVVWLFRCENDLRVALAKTLSTVQTVLRITVAHAKSQSGSNNPPDCRRLELRLIQCRDFLLDPELSVIPDEL